jgi:predicted RNA binding protein with dsRBD fold (UPF0201 family)
MKLLGKNLGYFSRSIKKERIYDTNKKALFTQIEDSLLNEMSFSLEKQGTERGVPIKCKSIRNFNILNDDDKGISLL